MAVAQSARRGLSFLPALSDRIPPRHLIASKFAGRDTERAVARTEELIAKVSEVLVEAAQPKRIILFGSRARGDSHNDSDFDVMVVKEQASDRLGEMVRLNHLLRKFDAAIDLLVVSEDRFQYWRDTPGNVYHEAASHGHTLMKRREQTLLLLAKAAQDESLLDAVLNVNAVADEIFGFHCQQAAEKMIKALLPDVGMPFQKTHNISALMGTLADAGMPFTRFIRRTGDVHAIRRGVSL